MAGKSSLLDAAGELGCFSVLLAALKASGLSGVLTSSGPFTIFAPTDPAFLRLPGAAVDHLLFHPEALAELLAYHALPFHLTAEEMLALGRKRLLYGKRFEARKGSLRVDGALVTVPDVRGSNGILHGLDEVLVPGRLASLLI